MRLIKLNTGKYLYIQERSDERAIDITLYDENKKNIDGGILEADIDINTPEAITECLEFMNVSDLNKLSFNELDPDEIEDFE